MNKDTNVITYKNIFTDNELNNIENNIIVQSYKKQLLDKKSIKFTIPFEENIKNKLLLSNINFGDITELPMMWIKGDIHKHIDTSTILFNNTYLIYITDDIGNLVIDGIPYPIIKGYGYSFKQGLEHETIGTDIDNFRLLIGPINEKGISVGATPNIYYMFHDPPDYLKPYYISPDNSKFINVSQIPSEYVVSSPYVLQGWYVFHVEDVNASYKIGDIILPNTPYNMDYTYWVYPIWKIPTTNILSINSNKTTLKPSYTDNSLIYYKPHSLVPGGHAGVKNFRVKSKRT